MRCEDLGGYRCVSEPRCRGGQVIADLPGGDGDGDEVGGNFLSVVPTDFDLKDGAGDIEARTDATINFA